MTTFTSWITVSHPGMREFNLRNAPAGGRSQIPVWNIPSQRAKGICADENVRLRSVTSNSNLQFAWQLWPSPFSTARCAFRSKRCGGRPLKLWRRIPLGSNHPIACFAAPTSWSARRVGSGSRYRMAQGWHRFAQRYAGLAPLPITSPSSINAATARRRDGNGCRRCRSGRTPKPVAASLGRNARVASPLESRRRAMTTAACRARAGRGRCSTTA